MLEGMMVHIWVAVNIPGPLKFAGFIDESRNKSISSKHGGFKILLNLQEKDCLNKNMFFVIICSSFWWISSEVLRKQFLSVLHIVIYV